MIENMIIEKKNATIEKVHGSDLLFFLVRQLRYRSILFLGYNSVGDCNLI